MQLRFVPAVDTDSRCSVAGAYIWEDQPPVLAVARASSVGRRGFTALHELGHHLQQTDLYLAQELASAGARGQVLEDAVCDAFAASIILPDELVDQHINAAGPTVHDIVDLHGASSASRAAVCVRAAQRIRSPGHVVLLDYDGSVQFAAAQGLPPVRKGSDQSSAPVIRSALDSSRTATGRTRLIYRDGIRGEELFIQIGDLNGYLVAVLTTDRPPWETAFVLPSAGTAPLGSTWLCTNAGCGEEFETFGVSCDRCDVPKCPECGACECLPAVAERRCTRCFLVYPARYFDGDSMVCLDCS
ncbi:ImmA/IrrE family metallo-endopeptidase [Ornithinimicrobium sp. CNJ-824]|uniref:ImmA/IrrE family metallo-endopeptidase n=1 Tax=Ornithinimicrobium sp. CNJ-824 TaxID=1904966 RepID=UPI0013015B35|nr:ImmA/IrrE family metallo-endopeptidase [Ornithinimicrobium sp. CNJ-824]